MADNLVKINLGFENVCGIDIPVKYIRNLRITDVTQHSSYNLNTNNGHNNHLYADSATFTVDYGELNKLDTRIDGLPIGKRIMSFHDIVADDFTELYDMVKYDPNKTERISLTRDERRELNEQASI